MPALLHLALEYLAGCSRCVVFVFCLLGFLSFAIWLWSHLCNFAVLLSSQLVNVDSVFESWRTRIDLDLLCLDETVLILETKFHLYDKNYLSSLAGVALCKRQSGTHSKCHDLSLDLSFDLSSTCYSRELILWINPPVQIRPSCRAHGPIHVFHLHLLHHLHPRCHTQFHLASPLHRAHPLYRVHQHKLSHPALRPFRPPNLAMPTRHIWRHLEVKQRLMKVGHMALISILTGKRTKIITTTRRSTGWPSHEAFVNRLSRKSWTLKGVILWSSHWRPCCISRPTTSGFASWLMDVNFTWFPQETSQRLYSRRSSWLNSEAKELT